MEKRIEKGKFSRFIWTAPDHGLEEITSADFVNNQFFRNRTRSSSNLRQLIINELGLIPRDEGNAESAKHIEYMRRHDLVDYCETSEKGHMKWFPKGLLIAQLLTEYGRRLAREWGAFEMKNPLLIRGDQNTVGQLMGEFHERDYRVDGGRGIGFLRYASDPLAFPFLQKVRVNERQMPIRVYEEANCFRNEQDGEVSGLKRMRWFVMTDMHAACSSFEQAKKEYELLTRKFAGLMNNILAGGSWVLGWEITEAHYETHQAWIKEMCDDINAPALIKVMKDMSHYYAFKNEFQSITADGSNVQVSTVQWDVKNGARFDIGYTGEDGQKHPSPVIIHASSIGSVERALCSILENIAIDEREGKMPQYPLWLAPTQLRVIPVNDSHVPYASKVLQYFLGNSIRTDLDDRDLTVGKKIAMSEKEWVPFVLVIGDKEAVEPDNGILVVRSRTDKKQHPISREGVVDLIRDQVRGLPYLELMMPNRLSVRPLFK